MTRHVVRPHCHRVAAAILSTAPLLATAADSRTRHDEAALSAPLVAAASDLRFALDAVIAQFLRDTGLEVRPTYGSSGNFAHQIAQGAPFELFLSADERLVDGLADSGLTRGRGELYAIGRIVVFAPTGSPLTPDGRLEHYARRLANGSAGRLAIANPEHAPYGRAAEQALQSLGLGDAAQARLVIGENVAQAAQFAASGDAEGGIIAYSLALAPEMRGMGTYALIPETLHEPLRQRVVLLAHATPAAERFFDYVISPPARAILERYGFTLPGD